MPLKTQKIQKKRKNSYKLIKFINLIQSGSATACKNPHTNYVNTIGCVELDTLLPFANESCSVRINNSDTNYTIPRCIPSYPRWKWDTPLHELEKDDTLKAGKVFLSLMKRMETIHQIYPILTFPNERKAEETYKKLKNYQ